MDDTGNTGQAAGSLFTPFEHPAERTAPIDVVAVWRDDEDTPPIMLGVILDTDAKEEA